MPKDRGDEKEGMQGRVKIKPELLDEALKEYRGPQDLEEIFKEFKKAVLERALGAELSQHLGYGKGEDKPEHQTNHRNGASGKRILTDQGRLEIEVPRDRESSFEPQLIKKGERRFSGFDDKIIAMYARGMTVREIQGYLEEMYGVLVSPDLISQVTDAVMEAVGNGRTGRWIGCIRWCSSTHYESKSVMKERSKIKRFIWPWGCSPTGPRISSGFGSNRARERSSGCG